MNLRDFSDVVIEQEQSGTNADSHCFVIKTLKRDFRLQAQTRTEMNMWL